MSRFAAILLSITVCIVVGVANAGQQTIAFLAVLLTDGIVAGVWTIGATLGGWVIVRAICKRLPIANPALLISTSSAIGLGIFSLLILGLGLAGWLSQWTILALPLLSILVFGFDILRNPPAQFKERIEKWLSGRATVGWFFLAVMPALGLSLVAASQPPRILWTASGDPHPYDVLEYHLQLPREWYEAGRIEKPLHNAFGFFPSNTEMHFLAAMYLRGGPWAGMYTAQFLNVAITLLTVVAVYGIGKQLTASSLAAVAGAVAAAAVPWLTMAGSVAFNEAGLVLYGALAAGWIAIAIKADAVSPLFILAGLCAGFACGTKYTAVPILLAGLPAAMGVVSIRNLSGRLIRNCVIFLIVGLAVFSPWLIRNIVWTGNPVFPEAPSLLGKAHFTDAQVARWHRAHTAPERQRPIRERLRAFCNEVIGDVRYGYVILPAGIAAAIIGRRRRETQLLACLILFLAVFWIVFTHLQSRFFILAVPLLSLLIAVGAANLKKQLRLVPNCVALCMALVGTAIVQIEYARNLDSVRNIPLIGLRELHFLLGDATYKTVTTPEIKMALIGDARAFLYTLPMKNLRYRTVFDIAEDGAPHYVDAFIGPDAAAVRREYFLQIVPDEIDRLNSSYRLNFKDWPPKPASRPTIEVGPARR